MNLTCNHRNVKITVNGKSYLVEVEDLAASPMTVKVNGQPYLVDIATDGVAKVSTSEVVTASETAARLMSTPKRAPVSAGPIDATVKEVKAPMPGHIVDIAVEPGDEVNVGQELCSLEAMKMRNAIRSHRSGIIAGVAVTLGQAVAYGDVLVTFE